MLDEKERIQAECAEIQDSTPKEKKKPVRADIDALFKITKGITSRIDGMNEHIQKMEKKQDKTARNLKSLKAEIEAVDNSRPTVIEYTFQDGETFVMPEPAKAGSIGDDLVLCKDFTVEHGRNIIPINFIINLPMYVEAKIEARSGFSAKGMLGHVITHVVKKFFGIVGIPLTETEIKVEAERIDADVLAGKIDPGYFNPVGVIIKNNGPRFVIPAGTHIAQITYYRTLRHTYRYVPCVGDFTPHAANREGGFGSSTDK